MAKRGGNKSIPDLDNPVIAQFMVISKELDEKNDRHERLVKVSRDITIESKRIIFLLHTIDERKDNKDRVLAEAADRLAKLCETKFLAIAKEMENRDSHLHIRAFSAGLQEFIEALTFYEFSAELPISGWQEITEKHFTYREDEAPAAALTCPIPPTEYMLGLQDTTGELMRKSINALGAGDVTQCTTVCQILRKLYENYISVGPTFNREWSRKMSTLRSSMLKAEAVCYNIKVRGKEAAKWSAAQSVAAAKGDEDEGIA